MCRYFGPVLTCAVALLTAACGGGSSGGGPVVGPPMPPPVDTPPAIKTTAVFTQLSFSQPTTLRQVPGDASRWFVAEKGGVIRLFANDPNATSSSIFLDISGRVSASGEGGLLGFAFHPDFPLTPEVFVSYTRGNPFTSYVSRFYSTDNGLTLEPTVEDVLLTLPQPASNHNGGNLAFGPDGLLYVGFGDGGGSGDPNENGQDTSNLHGTIVRIDVDGGTPYAIPAGNPFAGNAACTQGVGAAECPEIYAWGLRNPWRFSFDAGSGALWVGDVGQNAWEEIDRVEVGGNYGWNDREGAHCYDPPAGCATAGLIDPVTEYGRDVGASVTGGYVYRGAAIPDLVGWYLFGDFVSGRILAIPADSSGLVAAEEMLASALSIVAFGEDNDGELYVVDFSLGRIHRLDAAP